MVAVYRIDDNMGFKQCVIAMDGYAATKASHSKFQSSAVTCFSLLTNENQI